MASKGKTGWKKGGEGSDKVRPEKGDTGGGAHIQGSVGTEGGDFVGRDKKITAETYAETLVVEAGERPRLPWQLQPRAEHFTGREKELEQLSEGLRPGRVMTLVGSGGMGKTALAAEALWQLEDAGALKERFPEGLIWHTFHDGPARANALEQIALSFGEEPRPTPAEAARRVLGGRKALLVLDGVEQADDLAAVLEVRGGCGVLITTRRPKDVHGTRIDLGPLPEAEALLEKVGGGRAADEKTRQEMCELVGWLPLAVVLAGRYMAQQGEPAAEYLRWLRATPLEALHRGERPQESVSVMLDRSLEQLSEGARKAFAVTGLLALTPFMRDVVGVALGMDQDGARRAADELLNYGLLTRSEGRYQAAHPLVHVYVQGRLAVPVGALERLGMLYAAIGRDLSKRGPEGYAGLDLELPHFMNVLDRLVKTKDWQTARILAAFVLDYLEVRSLWTEQIAACDAAIMASGALEDRSREGAWLGSLGNTYLNRGQTELAVATLEKSLFIARETGDRQTEGAALGDLGNAYADLGQLTQAIEHYGQALVISQKIEDQRLMGNTLRNLGKVYFLLGQEEQGIEPLVQALVISRGMKDRRAEAASLGYLGNAYVQVGLAEKAIEQYQQALEIAREIDDRRAEGARLRNLGYAHAALGQVEKAIERYQQALEILEEDKSPDAERVRHWIAELEGQE